MRNDVSLSAYKAKLFGKKNAEPILRWTFKIKKGNVGRKPVFGNLDIFAVGQVDELMRHFVRGAPCLVCYLRQLKLN